MGAREGLPEDHADRPDVASHRRLVAREAFRGDVRQRPGDVTDRGQGVGLVELREPEVEHPDRERVALLDEHVRRLHVAVDDPAAMRVREAVEHLRGDLDRLGVADVLVPERLPQGAAADVLVGDVDVAGVAAEVVGAHTALVPQPRGGLHLPARPGGALPFARDDLERDLEARALVVGEPHGARASRPSGLRGR